MSGSSVPAQTSFTPQQLCSILLIMLLRRSHIRSIIEVLFWSSPHPKKPRHGGDKIGHKMGLQEHHGRNYKKETIISFEEELFEPKM